MATETIGAPNSDMRKEFENDSNLARKYLETADAKNLHALYEKRCKQLTDFGSAFMTMSELYAGKNTPQEKRASESESSLVVAIQSMERVALAALALAASVTQNAEQD